MPPVRRVTEALQTSSLDDRSYRVIELPNKLEALLVHDPKTDKASASVNVNVGSFSDADDMPGMAHAVEHLLFMGTEKYPVENAYSQYLSAHSGYSNAYTASTETNYFFEVAASNEVSGSDRLTNGDSEPATNGANSEDFSTSPLYGALDRFAQFFIAPLFLSSTLDRELRAVDSENKKNLQSDAWRLMQLNKSLSSKKHPYHHFSTGNLETLRDEPRKRGVDIRKEFIDFHDRNYSANQMKLVVLGRESLNELESWVADLFAGVRNQNLPKKRWDGPQPYSEVEYLTQVFAKPVMDSRSLEITFPYQDEEAMYDTQPSRYISHLIGHEGPGSILAYIKAKGWANALCAGSLPTCPGSAFFTVSVKLTEEGLEKYQEIVKVLFQYIALIKEQPPQKWIFDEIKGMAEVDFRFQQKSPASSFTSKMSGQMQKPLPRERLLSGSSLMPIFDGEAISKGLACLRTDNYRLMIVSQHFPGDWDQKEKWYGTDYKIESIPADFDAAVKEAGKTTPQTRIPELFLPHINEFIPTKLDVEKREVPEPTKAPKLIRNDEEARTWWKKDDQFWVPKGNVLVSMRNPLVSATPANVVKGKLYCELVKDVLVEYSYDAEIAGLDYGLASYDIGLDVDVSGYSDKMSVLLEKVLVSMRDLDVKADRFKIIKDKVLRGYRNFIFQQPYRQVGDFLGWLGREKGWINEHYLAELIHLTPEDISQFYPQILNQMHVEVLCHGNINKEDAVRMTDLVQTTLRPRTLPQSQWQVRRNLILPEGGDFTFQRVLGDPANINHCIEYYLHIGSLKDRGLVARLLLLSQMTDEVGFDQLRTKEQLGYIVFSGAKITSTTAGYRVIIQSEKPTEYLEERINAFLELFAGKLHSMSQEEFESHKKSLINKRLEKIKNLEQECGRFWSHISNEYFDFYKVDHDVAHIKPLTKEDMIRFCEYYINPTSRTRAKLSIHMIAQSSPKAVGGSMSDEEKTEKVLSLLGKFLTATGVEADMEKLRRRSQAVNIAKGEQKAIVEVVSSYLKECSVPEEQCSLIIEQGRQLLTTALPSLGIEVQPEVEEGAGVLPPAPEVKATTYVTNVQEFKASLMASAGPTPVTDLKEYEDIEPKL
ncbi:MAG: Insulinase (Peptidase M16) [Heterodermia speciosa]|uniref:Insulinase (Peptidase M16) n=1 Tax=Heterodermia speciosa TaxID=116794 RepID=A0A8H3ICI5_9LECA|nr:MAG: Insulinase (Peptidase M16) [Heterodermia speciosa]